MKPIAAIIAIRNNMPTKGTYTILTEGLNLAIDALNKRIPMKIEKPFCECGFQFHDEFHFCPDCGQMIDWRDEE